MVNFGGLVGKARELAGKHGDKVERAVDQAAKAADERTGGKHSARIADGAGKLKGAVDKVRDDGARPDPVRSDRPVAKPDPNASSSGSAPVAEPDPGAPADGGR